MDAELYLPALLDQKAIQTHVPFGSRLLVGVSGGADSVALLLALLACSEKSLLEIAAVHVNHGLRPSAATDEDFVDSLCASLKIPLIIRRLQPIQKPAQVSPEQHWRNSRYKEFADVMLETKSDYLALGHNANDLAETFLYHLARGTGVDGLCFSFMNWSGSVAIIRPLWNCVRKDIESALRSAGQEWINDPTNEDIRYSRNLIRHNVVPVLQQINPAVVTAIVNLSADLQQVQSVKSGDNQSDDTEILRIEHLRNSETLPTMVRQFVCAVNGARMDRRQTVQAVSMIREGKTGTVALKGKKTLVVTQELIWIFSGASPDGCQIAAEHVRRFGGLYANLNRRFGACAESVHTSVEALDGRQYMLHLTYAGKTQMRNRESGDRVGSTSLSKVLINFRIPWYLRDYIVLVGDQEGQVIGVVGHPPMHEWIKRHLGINYELEWAKSDVCA